MRAIAAVTVGVALVSTASASQSKPQPAATADTRTAIVAIADQYVKATLAADAKAIAALYTDDAVEMPPNHPPVKGRAALQQFYEKQFAMGKISNFTLQHLETRGTGDDGYDVGTYRQTMAPAKGQPMSDTGKYVVILKRTDGSWKVKYAIYNSDMPPPPPQK